jgi:hypothetical protein
MPVRAAKSADTVLVEAPTEPGPTAAELEAAAEVLARGHVARLRAALAFGRLESVLGAARGLEHFAGEIGVSMAAAVFKRAGV